MLSVFKETYSSAVTSSTSLYYYYYYYYYSLNSNLLRARARESVCVSLSEHGRVCVSFSLYKVCMCVSLYSVCMCVCLYNVCMYVSLHNVCMCVSLSRARGSARERLPGNSIERYTHTAGRDTHTQ